MRIAYVALKGGLADQRVPVSRSLLQPGNSIALVETRLQVYPTDPTELLLSDLAYAEAAMRADSEGFEAVVIGATADYGIPAARAALDIPVLDCGEASLLAAAAVADRFAIVTIWPQTMGFIYDRLLRNVPVGNQCVAVRHVSTAAEQASLSQADNFLTRMKAGKEDMIARILAEIDRAVAAGAQAVVLGCNCMTPVADLLARRSQVPVVDPTAAGVVAIQSLAALNLQRRRDERVRTSTRQQLLGQMLTLAESHGDHREDEECPVCVFSDEPAVV